MVRIKIFKASQLLYWAVVIVAAVVLIGLIANSALGKGDLEPPPPPEATTQTVPLPDTGEVSTSRGGVDRQSAIDRIMGGSVSPATEVSAVGSPLKEKHFAATTGGNFFSSISKWLLTVDLTDPVSVLNYHLPIAHHKEALGAVLPEGDHELPGESTAGAHILIEIANVTTPYRPAQQGKILIYHTHTYEAYEQNAENPYVEASAQWRTKEEDHSIVGVGALLADELTALGYEVVHDRTEFEPPKLGTSYVRSLEMLDHRRVVGEEYALVIDLHRDAWDKVQAQKMTVPTGNGEAARLMMLIGTGEGSEGSTFSIKPNWKENYQLADALTNALNHAVEGICRSVLVKTGRYNQHVYDHSVLIEVGNNRNTLEQVQNAIPPLATAIDQILSENRAK